MTRPKRRGCWVLLTLVDGTKVTGTMSDDLRLVRPEGIVLQLTGASSGETGPTLGFPRREIAGAVVLGVNGNRLKSSSKAKY